MYNVIVVCIIAILIMATPIFEVGYKGVGYVILAINIALDTMVNKIINAKRES